MYEINYIEFTKEFAPHQKQYVHLGEAQVKKIERITENGETWYVVEEYTKKHKETTIHHFSSKVVEYVCYTEKKEKVDVPSISIV